MNPNDYERLIFESLKGFNTYMQWEDIGYIYEPPEEETVRIHHKEDYGYRLSGQYIDAGVILKEGIAITREFMDSCSRDEWAAIARWADSMANVRVDEVLEDRMLWVYNTVPSITSLAA